MNFTSPQKSMKSNQMFESPSFMLSPKILDFTCDQNINTLNFQSTPFNYSQHQQSRGSPPSSQHRYSDRFIPTRADSVSKTLFDLKDDIIIEEQAIKKFTIESSPQHFQNGSTLSTNNNISFHNASSRNGQIGAFSSGGSLITPSKKGHSFQNLDENTMSYKKLIQRELFGTCDNSFNKKTTSELQKTPILKFHKDQKSVFTSPFTQIQQSQFSVTQMEEEQKEEKRKISKLPYKVLDAPGLQDDFYVDMLDWSSQNQIGVGLGKAIFIWNAETGSIQKLCINTNPQYDANLENSQVQQQQSFYTSLKWSPNGQNIAVGNQLGSVDLWDISQTKIIRTFKRQSERIGCIDFNNNNVFAAGSKDKSILVQDIRDPHLIKIAIGHNQEICQIKWSPDQQYLASGGNDNQVCIWDITRAQNQNINKKIQPFQKHHEHKAAVRALAWNPHQYGILLSGGGSRDQKINVWNVNTNSLQNSIEVGSQICKLQFSPDQNEFVCAHGFENNKITVWKYPTLNQIAELEGHQSRVLFMSLSPDNQNIVTGAGDETLKFWKVFQGKPIVKESSILRHQDLR